MTLLTINWVRTPILWCFLEPSTREKLKYLLLVRLLYYEVNPVWLDPKTYRAEVFRRLFRITEYPAVHLNGITYYARDIPVGPIRSIEKRRDSIIRKRFNKTRKSE